MKTALLLLLALLGSALHGQTIRNPKSLVFNEEGQLEITVQMGKAAYLHAPSAIGTVWPGQGFDPWWSKMEITENVLRLQASPNCKGGDAIVVLKDGTVIDVRMKTEPAKKEKGGYSPKFLSIVLTPEGLERRKPVDDLPPVNGVYEVNLLVGRWTLLVLPVTVKLKAMLPHKGSAPYPYNIEWGLDKNFILVHPTGKLRVDGSSEEFKLADGTTLKVHFTTNAKAPAPRTFALAVAQEVAASPRNAPASSDIYGKPAQ